MTFRCANKVTFEFADTATGSSCRIVRCVPSHPPGMRTHGRHADTELRGELLGCDAVADRSGDVAADTLLLVSVTWSTRRDPQAAVYIWGMPQHDCDTSLSVRTSRV
ncbi:hypothetical protein TPB0596_00700 [Tsukamurella pulmonis]|nr:hypothetical protein TPB0596_00700 [Tsukamurella pulmonis]